MAFKNMSLSELELKYDFKWPFTERLPLNPSEFTYVMRKNITMLPKCPNGNWCFIKDSRGYRKRCENSVECGCDEIIKNAHYDAMITKGRATLMARLGVDNVFKLKEYQDIASATMKRKHGVDNYGQIHLSAETKNIVHNKDNFIDFCRNKNFEMVADELGDISAVQIGAIARKFDCIEVFSFGRGSVYQNQCEKFISSLGFTFKRNTRKIIKPKEIDIYITSEQLGVEIDGLYSHTIRSGGKSEKYHYDKQVMMPSGSNLIQLFTDDWQMRRGASEDIIKRNTSLVNKFTKIKAQDCQSIFVDYDMVKQFIKDNSLHNINEEKTLNLVIRHNNSIVGVILGETQRGTYLVDEIAIKNGCVITDVEMLIKNAQMMLECQDTYYRHDARLGKSCIANATFIEHTKPKMLMTDYYKRYTEEFIEWAAWNEYPNMPLEELLDNVDKAFDRVYDSGYKVYLLT